MVHLQLALLVDQDYYLNLFLFEHKNLVDHDVVLKRKVHWLYTLVDPSKYCSNYSSEKYIFIKDIFIIIKKVVGFHNYLF